MVEPNGASVFLLSLGCDKNRVDGEAMGGALSEAGYALTADAAQADVIIVNTCGFIRDAVQESIDTVLSLAEYKRTGACRRLIVTGCMAERYREEMLRDIPEADAVLGASEYAKVVAAARGDATLDDTNDESFYAKRLLLPAAHVSYVKIAEGCDNHCTYCTIPRIRGAYRSRPIEAVVEECRTLVKQGARELVLVAQDTARYGTDLYGTPRLHELLRRIAQLDDLTWVRVMYAYPEHIYAELITAIAECPKVCNYLDMPIQHSHDAVLRRMGRNSTEQGLRDVITELRKNVPGIVLRTTLMVGFPGETEDEFAHLRAFAEDIRFDRLGVFAYSREDGTPAARMKQQVKSAVKRERRDALMRMQQGIHREKQQVLVGQTLSVMTDTCTPRENAFRCTGRSYRDAYETDACVRFTSERALQPGETVDVTITGCGDYDLRGNL